MKHQRSTSDNILKNKVLKYTDLDFLIEQEHKAEEERNMNIKNLVEIEEKEWSMIEYEVPKEFCNPDKYGEEEDDEWTIKRT